MSRHAAYTAPESAELPRLWFCAFRRSVTEKLLAFLAQETADDGDVVIALLEDELAGDEARAPFIKFVAVLASVGGDIFLGHAVDDGANFGPHASAGAHGAGLVGGVKDKVGQVAAIAAGDVFEHLQFDVLDAGARGFYAVACAGDDRLGLAGDARDDRANRIVAAVARALGLLDGKLHEFFLRFVPSGDHAVRL
jgi:hypothetical protein